MRILKSINILFYLTILLIQNCYSNNKRDLSCFYKFSVEKVKKGNLLESKIKFFPKNCKVQVEYNILKVLKKKKIRKLTVKLNTDVVDVTEMGVKMDGVTDNSNSLQNAINYASKNGKKLLIPSGVCLTNQINVPANIDLVGISSKTSILKLIKGTASIVSLLYIQDNSNFSIQDITLDANLNGNSGNEVYGLYLIAYKKTMSNFVIKNVNFKNSNGNGNFVAIGYTDSITNIFVNNCIFDSSAVSSIQLRGVKKSKFLNSTFSNWGLQKSNNPSFSICCTPVDNIIIDNCNFLNTKGTEFAIESFFGSSGYTASNIVISNCLFDGNKVGGNGVSGSFYNSIFKNNRHINGVGGQRSGYEIFGKGNNKLTNINIKNGQIVIYDGSNILLSEVTINTLGANNDACLEIGGSGNLNNVEVKNSSFFTESKEGDAPAIYIGYYGVNKKYRNINIHNCKIECTSRNQACLKIAGTTDSSMNLNITKNKFKGYNSIYIVNPMLKNSKIFNNEFSSSISKIKFLDQEYSDLIIK